MQRLLSTAVKAERKPRRRTLSRALLLLPLTALLAAALTGCSKPEAETFVEGPCEVYKGVHSMRVENNTFRCDGKANIWELRIKGNATWRFEGLPDWVTPSDTAGDTGSSTILGSCVKLAVDEFHSDEATRTADFFLTSTVNGWDESIQLRIVQKRFKDIERITIDSSSVRVRMKFGRTLRVNIYPEDADNDHVVRWASSNDSVATVTSGGFVNGIYEGECLVVATASNGVSDTCRVNVWGTHPESLTLDTAALHLGRRAEYRLVADIGPVSVDVNKVEFTSSDESVATVSPDGVVTGVSEGECLVVASVAGLRDTCRVKVSIMHVERIVLNTETLYMDGGWLEMKRLTATLVPPHPDADFQNITWSSSDTEVALVNDNGLVQSVMHGTAVVTATSGDGVTAECVVTVEKVPMEGFKHWGEEETMATTYSFIPDNTNERRVTFALDDTTASVLLKCNGYYMSYYSALGESIYEPTIHEVWIKNYKNGRDLTLTMTLETGQQAVTVFHF